MFDVLVGEFLGFRLRGSDEPFCINLLGLLLVRTGDKSAVLRELALAAKLAPDNARYAYVYAVGLNSAGKRTEVLAVLRAADQRHPYNLEILSALISVHREASNIRDALAYARKLAEVLPEDPGVKRLLSELDQADGLNTYTV